MVNLGRQAQGIKGLQRYYRRYPYLKHVPHRTDQTRNRTFSATAAKAIPNST